MLLRPSWPVSVSAVRSLLGVLIAVGFAVAFGAPSAAVTAGGGAAIAGATALQNSPRGKVPLVLWVSLAMAAAVLIGALTAARPALFTAVVVLWSFGVGMAWALGSNAGNIAASSSGLLIAASVLPTTVGQAFQLAAVTAAGGLIQALLLAVRPGRRWRVQREALTAAYLAVADHARAVATDPQSPFDAAPLTALRDAFTLTSRQAGRRPAPFRTLYGMPERIEPTLVALAQFRGPAGAEEDRRVPALLADAGTVLTAIAAIPEAVRPAAREALRRVRATAQQALQAPRMTRRVLLACSPTNSARPLTWPRRAGSRTICGPSVCGEPGWSAIWPLRARSFAGSSPTPRPSHDTPFGWRQ